MGDRHPHLSTPHHRFLICSAGSAPAHVHRYTRRHRVRAPVGRVAGVVGANLL